MPNAPHCSINFLLARKAPVGVLLRRGPSKLVQCLHWNLETDEVTPGQWLKGRIYEYRCDLSPDGKLFAYFAANHKGEKWDEGTWTAISRPPYLTALALWFKGDCWDGGGLFTSNDHVLINGLRGHRYASQFAKPKLAVGSLRTRRGEDWPIEHARRVRDGWKVVQDLDASMSWWRSSRGYTTRIPRQMTRTEGDIVLSESFHIRGFDDARSFEGSIEGQTVDLTDARHAEIDGSRGRIVYSIRGKLMAASGAGVKEIADLTDHQFAPISAAEWALQWP